MLPKDAPSESPNEGGSGSNVSGAATGSNVSASAATSNAGSPGEAPRMALQSMIDNMAVLGPKSEKRKNRNQVRAAIQVRVRTVPRMRKQAMEKVKPGRGRELVRRRIKKGKESQSTKRVDSRGVMLLCAGDAIHFAPLRSNFHFIFLFGRKRPSGICSKNCRS